MADRRQNWRSHRGLAVGWAALALACGHETIDLFGAAGGQGGMAAAAGDSANPDQDGPSGDGPRPETTGGAPAVGGAPGPGIEAGTAGLGGSGGGREPPPSSGGSGVIDIPSSGGSGVIDIPTSGGSGGDDGPTSGGSGGNVGPSPGGTGGDPDPTWPETGGFNWAGQAPTFGGSPSGHAGETPYWGGPGSPCQDSRDCDRDLYCDPAAHVCRPGCESDQDCAAPQAVCATVGELAGFCVECTGDHHCQSASPDRPWCLFYAGVCIQCYRDEDCAPPTSFCHPGNYTCAECLTSRHCDEGWQCDPMLMECRPW